MYNLNGDIGWDIRYSSNASAQRLHTHLGSHLSSHHAYSASSASRKRGLVTYVPKFINRKNKSSRPPKRQLCPCIKLWRATNLSTSRLPVICDLHPHSPLGGRLTFWQRSGKSRSGQFRSANDYRHIAHSYTYLPAFHSQTRWPLIRP